MPGWQPAALLLLLKYLLWASLLSGRNRFVLSCSFWRRWLPGAERCCSAYRKVRLYAAGEGPIASLTFAPPQGLLCFFAPLRRPLCSVRLSGDASPEQPTGVALGGGIPQQGSARLCSQGPQQTRGSPLTPRPLPGLLPELHPVAQPRGCCVPGSGGYRLSTGISQPVASASQPECTGKL